MQLETRTRKKAGTHGTVGVSMSFGHGGPHRLVERKGGDPESCLVNGATGVMVQVNGALCRWTL